MSQQLQHPLRGEATHAIRDPGKFSSALRAAYFALHARLGLRSAARTAVRTVARMAGAKRRTEHLPEQVLRRRTDSGRGEQPAEGEGLWFDANEALAAFGTSLLSPMCRSRAPARW